MNPNLTRRKFLRQGTGFCVACGAMIMCPGLNVLGNPRNDDDVPDPKKREYCGYQCPDDCPLYLATINNDAEAKKKAYETWQIKERYGLEFDPETMFCYTCKPGDKPTGTVLNFCDVRKCAIEKSIDCCIECDELSTCEKGVFSRYPDFHKGVIQLQEKYRQAT